MSPAFESDFQKAVDTLQFSSLEKEKLRQKMAQLQSEESNKVNVKSLDADQNTQQTWIEAEGTYKNSQDQSVTLTMSYHLPSGTTVTPTSSRTIGEVSAEYNYTEYLFVPVGYEPGEDTLRRMETDDHFQVSDGSDTVETRFYSSVSFVKDDIFYLFSTFDEVSRETLFSMAEEFLGE